MKQATHAAKTELPKPILPNWIMAGSVTNTPEASGFASGSALALLHVALHDPNIDVPTELLRNKLALRAAAHCLKIEGRVQSEADIRDAYLLATSGEDGLIHRGPAGDMVALWRTGSGISFRHAGWRDRLCALLPEGMQDPFPGWMEQAEDYEGTPIAKAALLLGNIVQLFPRQEAFALLCADAILARSLGWDGPLPLLALHLKGKSLREASQGEDSLIACHVAVTRAAQDTVRLAHDLARRAAHLRAVEPKLRTKGSEDAVRLFLSEEAVLPSTMLSPIIRGSSTTMTPRSARRFCERLIELGVVRELTGRSTFRLYGVSS
ncbi:DUF1403 family protein [Ahrensia marina]|nr:DUF1403 family protein [Ahrensia marina]